MRTSSPAAGRRAGVVALAATLLAGAAVATAPAALADPVCATAPTVTWTGGNTGGSWDDSSNWTPAAPTAAPSNVVIKTVASAGAPVSLTISSVSGTACGITLDQGLSSPAPVTVTLDGDLQVGDASTPGTVDVNGATLTLINGTTAFAAGSLLTSRGADSQNPPPGSIVIGTGETLKPSGDLSIDDETTLHLAGGSLDASTPSSLKEVIGERGQFNWDGGSISGDLTDSVFSVVGGDATRTLTAGSILRNRNAMEVESGALNVDGTIANGGIIRLLKGVSVTGLGQGVVQNGPGVVPNGSGGFARATLFVGMDAASYDTGDVTFSGVALKNSDILSVVNGMRLVLDGPAASASSLSNDSLLTQPFAVIPDHPFGAQLLVKNAALSLQGVTHLEKGFQLRVDDGGDGSKASLVADTSFGPVSLAPSSAAEFGTLAWASGTVQGPLTVSGIYAAFTGATGSRRMLTTSQSASSAPAALTLSGNTAARGSSYALSPPPTPMILRQDARVIVKGATNQFTDLTGPGAGLVRQYGTSGQSLTIDTGATLRRMPASSTTSTARSEWALVNVPIVNYGDVELNASLNAAGGYRQQVQVGASSTSARPQTSLLGYSALSSPTAVTIAAGGFGGKGTVKAPTLSVSGAWLGAGFHGAHAPCREETSTYSETCIGTLHVSGALKLSTTSDVQVAIRKETVNGKTEIWRDNVVVTGAASLAGSLTVGTGSGYTPTYLTAVSKIMSFPSRTGSFARIYSPSAPVGYGWRPSYDDVSTGGRGADVRLVDTGPPVIGYAGLPAFSQQNVLEVHYAAHDNQTGVASYDVRWRRAGGTSGTYSAWVAPSTWQHTTATFQVITGLLEGYTYCVQVRARDKAGNVSPWTAAPCTARELDDRYLTTSGSWTRSSGHSGWYDGTYTRTTSAGATLKRTGTFTRIAVSAYRCPTCGTLAIYSGSTLVKTWNLQSTSTGRVNYVSPVRTSATATVTLKSTIAGRQILVDALGLLR